MRVRELLWLMSVAYCHDLMDTTFLYARPHAVHIFSGTT